MQVSLEMVSTVRSIGLRTSLVECDRRRFDISFQLIDGVPVKFRMRREAGRRKRNRRDNGRRRKRKMKASNKERTCLVSGRLPFLLPSIGLIFVEQYPWDV